MESDDLSTNNMVKKVAIIFGSPRKESNTHILVKEAQKGLKEIGAESEIFFLNDMNIKGCQSCYHCKANDAAGCAVKDDMQKIYAAMEASDGIIVATPIYFSEVTGQTKLWEDRLFRYFGTDKLSGGKKAAFIFTQNQPERKLFNEHVNTFMNMIKMVGFDQSGCLLAANLMKGKKPMVTENKVDMEKAYKIGKNLFS